MILTREPSLGPTAGPVDLARALLMEAAATRAGLRAAPLHLGDWEVPEASIAAQWAKP